MALGLNGHLAKLGKLESFDYLIRGNEMISIGLLLGMSAAKRGTRDLLGSEYVFHIFSRSLKISSHERN